MKTTIAYIGGIAAMLLVSALVAGCALQESGAAKSDGAAADGKVSRLEEVRERGTLVCASRDNVPGYGYLDANGGNAGFDIDLCRAVAAAVLGDADAIEVRLITVSEYESEMRSGAIDMLARTVTRTSSRDAGWANFAQTMFYDGQGFMVRKDSGISGMPGLAGAEVCVVRDTTTVLNLKDFSEQNGLGIEPLEFDDTDAMVDAYLKGQCAAFTNDVSQLAASASAFADRNEHIILPGVISEEPLTPAVPHGDEQWGAIVRMVMAILIHAEAYGVASDSVPTTASGNTAIDRIFGLKDSYGQEELGLSVTVAQDVIRAVGNYGEIYDRHIAPLGLEREGSRNALWIDAPCGDCPKGGQIYAAPLR